MMKPITLVGLLCLLTPPLLTGQAQGAEPSTSAAAATSGATPATSAPAQPEVAAQPSAAAPSSAAAPAPAAAPTTATPAPPAAPVAAASATTATAPAAAPIPAPVAAEGDRSPNNRPMTSTPASGLTVDSGALQAVPLYRQDELLNWIEQGRHLQQVKQDRCQLTQDIEVRAEVMKIPSYQFLWGDMLAWGVCIKPNAELGVKFMWDAANQGLAPALEQLGRYYWKGTLVQKDLLKAETLMREAASLGFQRAQIEWVEMLLQGMGSPLDYEEAYHWLHGAVIGDKTTHQKAASLLSRLGNRMPANAIARAKAMH
ncbi:flagellar motor protein [Aeromonas dhakensis]|nr:flagellar motor protein [Aeromonas dhakensis]